MTQRELAQAAVDKVAAKCKRLIVEAEQIEQAVQERRHKLAAHLATVNAEVTPHINAEYCWLHEGINKGGWCGAVCREEEASR